MPWRPGKSGNPAGRPPLSIEHPNVAGWKWCNAGGHWQPIERFDRDLGKRSGRKSNCRDCCNANWRTWKHRKVER